MRLISKAAAAITSYLNDLKNTGKVSSQTLQQLNDSGLNSQNKKWYDGIKKRFSINNDTVTKEEITNLKQHVEEIDEAITGLTIIVLTIVKTYEGDLPEALQTLLDELDTK